MKMHVMYVKKTKVQMFTSTYRKKKLGIIFVTFQNYINIILGLLCR